jgi:Flp pilus assembly protein TadD
MTTAATAALLGCSSLPPAPWRVEPTYRVEDSGAGAAQGYLALARQYDGEQRGAQALDAYRKAAQAAPADAEVQNALGLALARQGQFGPAVVALRRAVALTPERAPLLNNLGYALLLDGRADEARAIFRLTLAVDPGHAMASRNLAHIDQQMAAAATSAAVPAAAVAVAAEAVAAQVVAAAADPAAATAPDAAAIPAAKPAAEPVAAVAAVTVAAPAAAPPAAPVAQPVAVSATTATVPARVPLAGVSIEIVNGNGITGAAARLRNWLGEQGLRAGRLANLLPYDSPRTQVLYRPGKAEQARELAQRMPVGAEVSPATAGSTRADLRVLLGHDVRHSAGCGALQACAAAQRLASAAD